MAKYSNKFAVYIAGGRIISMLAGFVMPLVLVRFMSQSDYGVFSQYFTLYTALYVILAMGVHTNLFYFCPNATKKDVDKYESNTIVLLLVFGVIATLLFLIPSLRHLVLGGSELSNYETFVILSITLAVPMNMISPLNAVREDKWGALLFPGGIAFSRIAIVVTATLMYNDLYKLFFFILIFQIVVLGVVVWYVLYRVNFKVDFGLMRKQLAYSIPFGGAIALQLLSNFFDKFVCMKYIEPAEYAVYAVAFLSIPGINQIYDSLCQVNIVNMSRSYTSGHLEEIAPQYGDFVVKVLSFSIPLILSVSYCSEEIITFLYTDKYLGAAPYFRLYTLTFLMSMLGAGTILRSMGKTKRSLASFLIACAIGLPLTLVLIRNYGTDGAIIGAIVNILLPRIIQMIFEIHSLKVSICAFLPWMKIWKLCIPSVLLLFPLHLLKQLCNFGILGCALVCAIYVLVLYTYYIKFDIFILEKGFVLDVWTKIKNKG